MISKPRKSAFTIEELEYEDEVELVRRKMRLSNYYRPNDPARIVNQLQLKNWPTDQTVPSSRNAVLRLVNLIAKSRDEQSAPTRVLGKSLITVVFVGALFFVGTFFMGCFHCKKVVSRWKSKVLLAFVGILNGFSLN